MKNIWNKWLKDAVLIYCFIFTIATIASSIIYLTKNIYEDPNGNWHELDRAIVVLIGVLAYEMAVQLPIKKMWIRAVITYIPTLGLALMLVWLSGFRETLAKSAYRDILINYTGMFLIICFIIFVTSIIKKKVAGGNTQNTNTL